MCKLELILFLCLIIKSSSDGLDLKIVGGNFATKGQFPYMVSLRKGNSLHTCGGSIINNRWILTAAHCVDRSKPEDISVRVGIINLDEKPENIYRISNVFVHPAFNHLLFTFITVDVALLKVSEEIKYNMFVMPIKLGSTAVLSNQKVILSGWGKEGAFDRNPSKELKYMEYETMNQFVCRLFYFNIIPYSEICVFKSFGNGACFGDSGSPLVSNGVQIGIVSKAVPCGVGRPDIFARVSYFLPWIKMTIEKNT